MALRIGRALGATIWHLTKAARSIIMGMITLERVRRVFERVDKSIQQREER